MLLRRRADAARNRRLLLWTAAVFLALETAGGLVLDYRFPQIRFPFAFGTLDKLRAEPHAPDLVYLGSSRFGTCLSESELTHELRRLTGKRSEEHTSELQSPCNL